MAGLNKYNNEKLIDDLKLIGKSIKIMGNENNQENRKYAEELTLDLLDRLFRDIEEMTDKKEKNGKTYGGTVRTSKKKKEN